MSTTITIKDVAKAAGVSEATVSRALNHSDQVKRDTQQKIQNIANNLGYHPNGLARSIRMQQSHTLGVIIPDILNDFFTQFIRAIEDASDQAGYDVVIVNTDEHPEKETRALNLMLEKRVDGLIIASAEGDTDYRELLGGMPTVFVDRTPLDSSQTGLDRILVDNVQGTRDVVAHLIKQGAQRIGIINSAVPFTAHERRQGYHQALAAAELPQEEAIEATARTDNSNVEQMTRQILINQKCDGLFVADNIIMAAVLRKLPELNLPHLYLGGFDDQSWFDLLEQPIVTARQPVNQLGQLAVEHLLQRIQDPATPPQEIRLATTVIDR